MQRPPPATNRPNRPAIFDTRANQAPIRPPRTQYIMARGIRPPPVGSTNTSPAYSTDYEFDDPTAANGEETFTELDRM